MKLNQTVFGAMIGLTRQTVANFEKGKYPVSKTAMIRIKMLLDEQKQFATDKSFLTKRDMFTILSILSVKKDNCGINEHEEKLYDKLELWYCDK